jgi:hypothetical protein
MKKGLLAFLIYCGLTVALTYPLILNPGSVLPHDAGDPALNTWILWWNTKAVPLSAAWWNPPAFFPAPGVLSFSENLLGLSLISTPLHWLGAGPQMAYNIVFLLTFPLSAVGAYLLGYELTRRHDAAFIAGLLFGFAPYRIAHMPQVQALASFPMPFAMLGLHRYLRDPRPKWLALFAAGWFLQGLCNGYYLLFFSVFVGLWILWFASPWSRPGQCLAIAIAWAMAAIPILPLLLRYRAIHASFGFTRDFGTIRQFGADAASLLHATSHLAWWGWLHVFERPEGELFPGLTISILVLAGALFVRDRSEVTVRRWVVPRRILFGLTLATAFVALSAVVIGPWQLAPFGALLLSVSNPVKPLTFSVVLAIGLLLTSPVLRRAYTRQSVLGFYALAGFMTWLLSLGPAPTLMGDPLLYRGPYTLLMYLPGFSTLRVPARFWMMTTLSLAVIGAIVFDHLAGRLGRARSAIAAVIAIGVLADTWMTAMPLAAVPQPFAALGCDARAAGPIMELPLGDPYADVAAMYRQMSHGRPVLNGYSGYFPPHYTALRSGLALLEPGVLTQLAAYGVTEVVVDRERDARGPWEKYVSSHPLATHVCTEGKQSLYRLTAPAAAAMPAQGAVIPVARLSANVNPDLTPAMVDGDLATRWQSGPQGDGMRVDIELGQLQTVQGLDVSLGRFVEDFPRSVVIEVSEDGRQWQQVWKGGSAGLALIAAFDPDGRAPMKYRFAPVQALVIRMRLTADDEIYYWSIAELRVVGL